MSNSEDSSSESTHGRRGDAEGFEETWNNSSNEYPGGRDWSDSETRKDGKGEYYNYENSG